MSNIEISRNEYKLDFKSFVFPGGEIGVKLDVEKSTAFTARTGFFATNNLPINITARLQSAHDIMELYFLVNALHDLGPKYRYGHRLILPYCPYSRQDRVCVRGEAFSLGAFAAIINRLRFFEVITFDPHSAVTEAVFCNLKAFTQKDIISKFIEFGNRILGTEAAPGNVKFLSPDAGANAKTAQIAKYFNHSDFVRADKKRNLNTGEIIETIIYCDDFGGADVVVVDDIIDGGQTYIKLAEAAKKKNCGKFILYATHGIFSKGVDILFSSGIDEIWTTNSYKEYIIEEGIALGKGKTFKVFDIDEIVKNYIN